MPSPDRADSGRGEAIATPGQRLTMYLVALRRHWQIAACIVIAAVTAGLAVAALSPKSYDATAKVLIGQRAQVDALLGGSDYNPDPERELNTNLELITLEPVAETASRQLGLGLSAAELASKVGTETAGNSNVVSITARDSDPSRAARIANAFARAYRGFRARSAQAGIEDAVASAERRVATLPSGPERDALDAELRRMQAAAAFQSGGVQIMRLASAQSAAASGGLLSTAILAGLLGMVLAAVAVIVLARTDKLLRDEGDLEAALGAPVLATMPTSHDPRSAEQAHEAAATLAVSVTLGSDQPRSPAKRPNGHSPRVVLVTSPGGGAGTGEVTLRLATALGEMSKRVIAIDTDLREPSVATQLGLNAAGGLAAVLKGTRTLQEVLVDIHPLRGSAVRALPAERWLLPPQPLLAGPRMAALVAEASRMADVVLVAGAPIGPFGDSLALVPLADAVLVVARLDATRRDEAVQLVRAVERLNTPLFGAVATTGAPRRPDWDARQADPRRGVRVRSFEIDVPSSNGSAHAPEETPEVTSR